MAYIETVWQNEVPNGLPLRYRITDFDGTVLATGAMIELLNTITPGTPVNATNLNKLEGGVKAAAATADSAVTAASAAQGTANLAKTSAAAAQTTANTAVAAAATAQTAANTGIGNAAAAQATANTAVTNAATAQSTANGKIALSLAVAKGDILVASGAGVFVRVAKGNNGQAIIYDSAQASGVRPGSITPEKSITDLGSEASTSSQTYATELTATVTLAATGRIHVRATGWLRPSVRYGEPTVRLLIDGVADPVGHGFQMSVDPPDLSWRSFTAEWFREGIAAGTRTVELQLKNAYAAGNAILKAGARLVVEVDYPS
jgi:hypothetical protein